MIQSITLDRLRGTGGGAHTTAFQLFLEVIQNNVINATYKEAIERLDALVEDTRALPGYDALHKAMVTAFKSDYGDAKKAISERDNHACVHSRVRLSWTVVES